MTTLVKFIDDRGDLEGSAYIEDESVAERLESYGHRGLSDLLEKFVRAEEMLCRRLVSYGYDDEMIYSHDIEWMAREVVGLSMIRNPWSDAEEEAYYAAKSADAFDQSLSC